MGEVEVVVAHSQRATLRVGDVFLKVDGDPAHADVEVRAMAMAPTPAPPRTPVLPPIIRAFTPPSPSPSSRTGCRRRRTF